MALGRRGLRCINRLRQGQSCSTGVWSSTCGAAILSDRMFVLGAIHILSGITVLSLGVMSFLHRTFAYEFCVAIIGGCLLVATGVLGILTAHLRTTCTLLSFFICAIFCVATAALIFVLCIVGIALDFGRGASTQTSNSANSNILKQLSLQVANIQINQLTAKEAAANTNLLTIGASINSAGHNELGDPGQSSLSNAPGPPNRSSNSLNFIENYGSQRSDFVAVAVPARPVGSSDDSAWRRNALSIHCTQLAASVLALSVALVATISCAKRICFNPNVSFFESRVRVSLVLPQLFAAPPLEGVNTQSFRHNNCASPVSLPTQTDQVTQTESNSNSLQVAARSSEVSSLEVTSQSNSASLMQLQHPATFSSSAVRVTLPNSDRESNADYSNHLNTGQSSRMPLTLSSANRHMRSYYRCGMPIGPFFINTSDLPNICSADRLPTLPAATDRCRTNELRPSLSSVAPSNQETLTSSPIDTNSRAETTVRRSIMPSFTFLHRRSRNRGHSRFRRPGTSLPSNRVVYLYTTSRNNELEGYVYPAPPPPYSIETHERARENPRPNNLQSWGSFGIHQPSFTGVNQPASSSQRISALSSAHADVSNAIEQPPVYADSGISSYTRSSGHRDEELHGIESCALLT